MSLPRLSIVLIAALVLPFTANAYVCGGASNEKPHTVGHFVSLAQGTNGPFFYFRLDDYVVLMQAQVVLKQLNAWSGKAVTPEVSVLRSQILASLPLRDDIDLYRYILHDVDLWYSVRWLVISRLEAGDATLLYIGPEDAVRQIYVEHDYEAYEVSTGVWLGKPHKSLQLMRVVKCIADPIPVERPHHKTQRDRERVQGHLRSQS